MKLLNYINLNNEEKDIFREHTLIENINRSKIQIWILVALELVLSIIDIITSKLGVDKRFHFDYYLYMYILMIIINIIFFIFIKKCLSHITRDKYNIIEISIIFYITFNMTWGSVISLMDQKLYGQVMAFMVNMIVCSVIYYFDYKKMILPYLLSILTLFIGLPFFQSSKDVLIGHYINTTLFCILSWIASRILYFNYYNYFKSNDLLKIEIKKNIKIKEELKELNKQLMELSLIDELTKIPNRRGFNEHIDSICNNVIKMESSISIIMMDIDYFKEFNDYYGHTLGDQALISVAQTINSFVDKEISFAARYGGEEFVFISVNTNKDDIYKVADRIKYEILNLKIPHISSNFNKYLTISLGVSTLTISDKNDIFKCIDLADKALYLAKNNGRNCIK